ncbi:MAG TPA: VOC family protein [Terriglobales bacterium]|nr:VOC family protein [Terriglobales bacterium]
MPKTKRPKKPPKSARPAAKAKAPAAKAKSAALDFNHAMIYAKDVARSTAFYSGLLGFKLIDEFRYEGQPVYARLRAKAGNGTIAIHQLSPGAPNASEGVRLYFEVEALDDVCAKLKAKGVYFTQLPKMMPWGWKHAYLDDPDNHEISLYWAGANRMKKTVMRAGKEAAGKPR